MARRPSNLDNVRASVRRFQLTIGLGFAAIVIGTIFSGSLMMRLAPRLAAIDSDVVSLISVVFIRRLWILVALPVLAYGFARIIDLKPVQTAVGAAMTGELFQLAIDLITGGNTTMLDHVTRVVTAVLGVGITMFAVKSARSYEAQRSAAAQKAAQSKKSEYEEFTKEAERLAALRDKPVPEGAAAEAPKSASTADAAPADAPPKPPESPPTGT